jgi:hypothetical protein
MRRRSQEGKTGQDDVGFHSTIDDPEFEAELERKARAENPTLAAYLDTAKGSVTVHLGQTRADLESRLRELSALANDARVQGRELPEELKREHARIERELAIRAK